MLPTALGNCCSEDFPHYIHLLFLFVVLFVPSSPNFNTSFLLFSLSWWSCFLFIENMEAIIRWLLPATSTKIPTSLQPWSRVGAAKFSYQAVPCGSATSRDQGRSGTSGVIRPGPQRGAWTAPIPMGELFLLPKLTFLLILLGSTPPGLRILFSRGPVTSIWKCCCFSPLNQAQPAFPPFLPLATAPLLFPFRGDSLPEFFSWSLQIFSSTLPSDCGLHHTSQTALIRGWALRRQGQRWLLSPLPMPLSSSFSLQNWIRRLPRPLPSAAIHKHTWFSLPFSISFTHSLWSPWNLSMDRYCWLNCVPQKDVEAPALEPVNMTLFGNQVFADVIKWRWGH